MSSRKPPFTVWSNSVIYSVVEFVDDVELLHGYGIGKPSKGLKLIINDVRYRVAEVFEDAGFRRVVVVERSA